MIASQVATAVVAAESHEATEHDARRDPLTGLPNRRQLDEDFREHYAPMLSFGLPVAAAMLDLDHFKLLNDRHGHVAGDHVLQQLAATLRGSLSDQDRVYRYGGEEFIVLLEGLGVEVACQVIERVRRVVAGTVLAGEHGEPLGGLTISAGVAVGPFHATTLEDLVARADADLYVSKRNGRDRVTYYAPELDTPNAA